MEKKIVYVDMDNVLVDFPSAFDKVDPALLEEYTGRVDEIPNIFSLMDPLEGAIEAFNYLAERCDLYILSTAPWENPSAWSDKLNWVKRYLGPSAHKRLILSHNKNLNRGDILIDDRTANGAGQFKGTFIKFGSAQFPNWESTLPYVTQLLEK